MKLTQDFNLDFDRIVAGLSVDYGGEPFAFTRFADGEVAFILQRAHRAKSDGWRYDGQSHDATSLLIRAASCYAPGWYVGVACPCHEREDHDFLMDLVNVPLSRITFAGIFIYANYSRFESLDLSHCIEVSCDEDADYRVARDEISGSSCVNAIRIADSLIEEADAPIVLAAGPLANIIAWRYWTECPCNRRQVIVDVGSALDLRFKPRPTRHYQKTRRDVSRRVCRWSGTGDSQ